MLPSSFDFFGNKYWFVKVWELSYVPVGHNDQYMYESMELWVEVECLMTISQWTDFTDQVAKHPCAPRVHVVPWNVFKSAIE